MKAIIIDDLSDAREALKQDIADYCPEIQIIGEADSVISGVKLIKQLCNQIDVLFLDIEMPDGTGFDLLEMATIDFPVIFTTAHDVYAIKAFKFSAFDYLLKPIDADELLATVNRLKEIPKVTKEQVEVFQSHSTSPPSLNKKISLSDEHSIKQYLISDIIRCQSHNNYTQFYFQTHDSIVVSKPLKEYDNLLSEYGFIRTHQSHLVNKAFIEEFVKSDGGYLVLQNNDQVPVSTRKKQEVISAIQK